MAFKEIELKYRADHLKLEDFQEFAKNRDDLKKTLLASGYDHFYSSASDKDAFCRHRVGPDINQLTFKRKQHDANNYVRTEHNIDMKARVTTAQVTALYKEFGYEYNTSIFKTCFVYTYEWYTLVFYVVYDTNMQEKGRFFEIEAREDYPWDSEGAAWDSIVALERLFKPMGISAQNRLKKSLWEMFRKE